MTASQRTRLKSLLPGEQIQTCDLLTQQGHSNRSYRLDTDRRSYFLRLFTPSGLDRKAEYRIQTLAYAAGVAPAPIALDIDSGIMISLFAEGVHRTQLTDYALQQLGQMLSLLHRQPCQEKPVPFEIETDLIETYPPEPVLCHNDLNPRNILWQSQKPLLIDWEYAGQNDRYFDLASLSVEFALERKTREYLLHSYFSKPAEADHAKLDAYMLFYRAVCSRWWEKQHASPSSSLQNPTS